MARYDWNWRGGQQRPRGGRGYGSDFGRWGNEWGSSPSAGFHGRGTGLYRDWGTPAEAGGRGGYDREVYGGNYPTFGGYPGARERGMYWGGYDADFAGEPFMPEEAYSRHPEYGRPQRSVGGRWPDSGGPMGRGFQPDDREVRQIVRENLHSDSWIDPDRIEVEVEDGVVTLRGEVGDYMEARYAWDDAWESAGVRGVINQLTVRTERPSTEHGEQLPQTE